MTRSTDHHNSLLQLNGGRRYLLSCRRLAGRRPAGRRRRAVKREVLAGSTDWRHRRQRLSGRSASTKPNDRQATRSGAGRANASRGVPETRRSRWAGRRPRGTCAAPGRGYARVVRQVQAASEAGQNPGSRVLSKGRSDVTTEKGQRSAAEEGKGRAGGRPAVYG